MDIVQVYVVAGPTSIFFGGRNVPGGHDYLNRNLRLLANVNLNVNFQVKVAHSVYHGQLSEFDTYPNMQVEVQKFDDEIIKGLSNLDPVIQHGALLNELLSKHPPSCRFVLILDPDCFAIEVNLISQCIQEMENSNISVAGVVYPASFPKEYSWKTPQLYFCLFDREVIRLEEIDFRAGNNTSQNSIKTQRLQKRFSLKFLRGIRKILLGTQIIEIGSPAELILNMKGDWIQRRYELNPLDTGWRLGELIEKEKIPFIIFPNILTEELEIRGFNCSEYLLTNKDLSHLSGHLGWYFFRHGLIEAREIGIQGLIPRMLNRFIQSDVTDRTKWPTDSLLGRDRVLNLSYLDTVLEAIPTADCYAIAGKFSLFHLGSRGKSQGENELKILDKIIAEIILKTV